MPRKIGAKTNGARHDAQAGPIKISETLMRFAEPLFDRSDPTITESELRALLGLAVTVWNAESLRASGRDDHGFDTLLTDLGRDKRSEARGLASVMTMMVRRKRTEFAHVPYLIGEWVVSKDAVTGEIRIRVEARSLPGAKPTAAKRRPRSPKSFVTDMRHYAGTENFYGSMPTAARRLADYFGEIVAHACQLPAKARFKTDVACRRRNGASRCKEQITLLHLEDLITWECPGCGENGTISGWRGSPWDVAERERRLASLPRAERLTLQLPAKEVAALERTEALDALGLGALLAAEKVGARWRITATRDELESLAVAAMAETCGEFPPMASVSFEDIHERVHEALGTSAHALDAARTADILCYRAIADPTHVRSVPRVEESASQRLSVVLADVEPQVRRELVVRSDTTLEELHCILQVAFGWTESHLHAFAIEGKTYMNRNQAEPGECDGLPTDAHRLLDVAGKEGSVFVYEYDFGDSWTHAIRVVGVDPFDAGRVVPRCAYGEGAAPPEDCGGPGGYEELQRVLADPKDEEHEHYRQWAGEHFDPLRFDLASTNRLLSRLGAMFDATSTWPRAAQH